MKTHVKSFFDVTKLPTKIFLLLAVITGFLLFAKEAQLQALNLAPILETYGTYVGSLFLFSAGVIVVNFVIWLIKAIRNSFKVKQLKKDLQKEIKRLDAKEKAVMREFSINGQSSLKMPIDDPVVAGLLNKQILEINSQIGESTFIVGMFFPMSVNKYAAEMLTIGDVDLPLKPTEADKIIILSSRPEWAQRLDNLMS
ncbi:super-infection exclusion protein B [Pontibacter harenae]|uniref:super-infection exclusion protein B n=1 Tax=Pontibacter harenae TaxID=2894083 RepID=UPI001E50D536|nr:superinfection exclusion B family protein [Pontibacter harenae]